MRRARHQARPRGDHARHPERRRRGAEGPRRVRHHPHRRRGEARATSWSARSRPKGETQLSPEEKLLRAIFGEKAGEVRDTSPAGAAGRRGHGDQRPRLLAQGRHRRTSARRAIEDEEVAQAHEGPAGRDPHHPRATPTARCTKLLGRQDDRAPASTDDTPQGAACTRARDHAPTILDADPADLLGRHQGRRRAASRTSCRALVDAMQEQIDAHQDAPSTRRSSA